MKPMSIAITKFAPKVKKILNLREIFYLFTVAGYVTLISKFLKKENHLLTLSLIQPSYKITATILEKVFRPEKFPKTDLQHNLLPQCSFYPPSFY